MCGIFGVINLSNKLQVDKKLFKEATNLLEHRGPDGEGFYFDDSNGVGFGHRRLSILDLQTGDQPMCNEDGTIWIVFNGEIYNYKEIKKYLLQKGHIFKTKSDTEVIIHAYEEFGDECPNKFNGIFAFAIWDLKKKKVFLARDHFGVKPLYYYNDNNIFVFASEIKSIIKYINIKNSVDLNSLYECLTLRYVLGPETLFNQIKKMLPSSYLTCDYKGNIILRNYWDKKIEVDYSKSNKYWKEILENQIEEAVKRQIISDVPIGLSLSGGVDSATILSIITQYVGKGVHCFTVGFEGGKDEDNEIDKAKEISKIFNANFHSYIITEKDYLDFLEKYIWHLEEPVGNESAIAYYYVANLAKGKVKVLLNGQGADEPFAGYDRYLGFYYNEKYPNISFLISKLLFLLHPNLTRKKQFEKLLDQYNLKNDTDKIINANQVITRKIKNELLSNSKLEGKSDENLRKKFLNLLDSKITGLNIDKLLFFDLFSSLPENLLLCEDKMAMAASIEARVPFLDIDLVTTASSIPAKHKIGLISGKQILKKVCTKYLPQKIVYQRKIGFNNPVQKWFQNSLGTMFLDFIHSNNSITKNYLNFDNILKIYNQHKNNEENHEKLLFLLFSIEKWNKIFLNK